LGGCYGRVRNPSRRSLQRAVAVHGADPATAGNPRVLPGASHELPGARADDVVIPGVDVLDAEAEDEGSALALAPGYQFAI
jgi:hypothetical protein